MFNQSSNRFDPNFKNNSTLIKLIYANLAVFIGIKVLVLPFWLMQINLSADQFALNWLAVPADLGQLLVTPWTVFSYMFLHLGFFHILSNMLWLYFLGQLFVEFLGERKLWTVYIAGGLAGALLYILFFNLFPVFHDIMPISKALGASASVMAIVVAVGTYAPNFSIRLLFLGNVKLKYIAIFSFVIDVISISNSNSGGHIAHIGGAALGFFFARQWRSGKDITAWVNTATEFVKAIFSSSKKSRMKVKYKSSGKRAQDTSYKSRKKEEQDRVDEILDKISRSGYDSLTKAEKDFLFRASNNK
jgi:membrane associated rhomboid family serine protease